MTSGHRLADVVAKLRETASRMGSGNAALYIVARLLGAASGNRVRLFKYLIVAQPIGSGQRRSIRSDPATVIALTPRDSAIVEAFPRPANVIRHRFDSGALCFSALVKGTFAGFIWIRRNGYDEDEVRCRFALEEPSRSVWDFDVYIEPRFRIGRTLARLWSAVEHELAATGVEWSFSRISAFNPESLAAHSRLGIVGFHSAVFLLAGPLQLALLPQWPYIHLSGSPRSQPTLRLRAPPRP